MSLYDLPYMGGYPQKVVGPATPQPPLFGVLGMFHASNKTQALQSVVERPSHYKLPPLAHTQSNQHDHSNTERHLLGKKAATHIPGIHHGMVPFAGRFMSGHGDIEVYHGHHPNEHHKKHHKHAK